MKIKLWKANDRVGDFSAREVLINLLDLPLGWTVISEQRDAINLLTTLEGAGEEDEIEVSPVVAKKIYDAIDSGKFAVPRLSPNMFKLLENLNNGINELNTTA